MIRAQALAQLGYGKPHLRSTPLIKISCPSSIFTAHGRRRFNLECMSDKTSSHSRVKTIKVMCDRCKQVVEGIRGEEYTAGFYDMTKWEECRRENEHYVCDSCMFADPKYLERYGSCF